MFLTLGFITFLLFTLKVSCIEEPERELFLQPRNFNPHPYQAKLSFSEGEANPNRGPVLFPDNPPDPLNPDSQENLVDGQNPYAPLVRKFKYRLGGLLESQEQFSQNQALEALTIHGAKVLQRPPEEGSDSSLSDQKKSYAFSYKVQDHISGDDFSHKQEQRSGATSGEYRVKLPDGRIQIVTYIADQNGYKADVKYAQDHSNPQPEPAVFLQNFPKLQAFNSISVRPDSVRFREADQEEYVDDISPLSFETTNSLQTYTNLPTYVQRNLYTK